MTSGSVETVIWLGAGASYGSQIGKIPRSPPMAPDFFSDSSVQERLTRYPVLNDLWRIFGRPPNLENFRQRIDEGWNSPDHLPACDIGFLDRRLRDSVFLHDADAERKAYYEKSVASLLSPPTMGTYLRAIAVAGWELKHLLVGLLGRGDYDLALLRDLFKAVRGRFAILTFNYDAIAEQALAKAGLGFRYELGKDNAILVSKTHGSIQWEWRKPMVEFIRGVSLGPPPRFGMVLDWPGTSYFRDSLLIGLRTKRELTGQDTSDAVNRFWEERLSEASRLLSSARRVVIIGFSFQEADSYLWDRLSAKQLGGGKRVLFCDDRRAGQMRDDFRSRIRRFFESDDITFYWGGFDKEFINKMSRWSKKR